MEKLINTLFKGFEKIARQYDPIEDESKERLEKLKEYSKRKEPSISRRALAGAGIGALGGAGIGALAGSKGARLKASLLGALAGGVLGGAGGASGAMAEQDRIRRARVRIQTPKGKLLRELRLQAHRDRERNTEEAADRERMHQINLVREGARGMRDVIHGHKKGPFGEY